MLRPFYADAHILAVCKPAGLLSVGARDSAACAMRAWLSACFGYARGGRPPLLLPVHRLDQPASGVLLLARTRKAASRLCAAWREPGAVRKTYLVRTAPPSPAAPLRARLCDAGAEGTAVVWLAAPPHRRAAGPPSSAPSVRGSLEPFAGATRTTTRWRLLGWAADGGAALELEASGGAAHGGAGGARHQVRLACALDLGAPVAGDVRYGAPRELAGSTLAPRALALHAHTLSVPYPVSVRPGALPQRRLPRAREGGCADDARAPSGGAACYAESDGSWAFAAEEAAEADLAEPPCEPHLAAVARGASPVRVRATFTAAPPAWWPLGAEAAG